MLRTRFRQSEATVILRRRRSAAKFRPSRQAIASRVSGSVTPLNTTADAPRKVPSLLRATAAIAPVAEFFDTTASTLTLSEHNMGTRTGQELEDEEEVAAAAGRGGGEPGRAAAAATRGEERNLAL
jgi:hypothetical protein